MKTSSENRRIIRDVAKRVAEIAALPEQAEKIRLWTACNDLKPKRAMVLASQPPWEELDAAWLSLECEDPAVRSIETDLRRLIIRHEHMPDDFPVLGVYKIPLAISGDGYDDYGIKLHTISSEIEGGSYRIQKVIETEADISRLHPRPIRIDHEATDRAVDFASDLFGDILEVRKTGKTLWRYGLSRVLVHMRGIQQMMLDMYDNPGLIHKLMSFLRDDFLHEIEILEQHDAVELNNTPDNVNGSGGLSPTTDLPGGDYDGRPRIRNCICWAESQETVGVSPSHFDEFVLQYQLPIVERFGLTDYGCCEPLDHKLDLIMKKIPNLRWVAVSPWADRRLCADKIGGKYVYVYKPNPSRICSPVADWAQAERDVRETLKIAGPCPVHVCMKDTKTFCNEPDRITRWCEMAVRVAKEAAQ